MKRNDLQARVDELEAELRNKRRTHTQFMGDVVAVFGLSEDYLDVWKLSAGVLWQDMHLAAEHVRATKRAEDAETMYHRLRGED